MKAYSILMVILALVGMTSVHGDDFFSIGRMSVDNRNGHPALNVLVSVKNEIKSNELHTTAYFYDAQQKLIGTVGASVWYYGWPIIFPKDKKSNVFFMVPGKVLKEPDRSAVVTFGDSKEVEAQVYKGQTAFELVDYDFPEKNMVEDKTAPDMVRTLTMDPLVVERHPGE
jgi:hypothetical protein